MAKRKGFSLLELVLAVAITAILVTNVGYLVNSAVRMRQLARTREELLQTSMRIHSALVGNLQTAAYATVYEEKLGVPSGQSILYCENGRLWLSYNHYDPLTWETSEIKSQFMPYEEDEDGNVVGFDYYNGAILQAENEGDAPFSIRIIAMEDYNVTKDPAGLDHYEIIGGDKVAVVPKYYRGVEITTTLFKNNRYYTHTSTIRLNELALYADDKKGYTGELSVGDTLFVSHTAKSTDASKEFHAIAYTNKG